ncbi:MAG: helix-hairpin-helix domain-containing protein [Archangiaceae bacterium]|nr:helix-hairpin-helix domain-containing protein [Archangiaceae bacterium]
MTVLAALAVGVCLMGATGAQAAAKKSSSKVLSGVINLNTASAGQLDQMPGVGPKAAERIIAYRSKTPFGRPEDLVKVKGFGKKKLDKLKAHLTVSGPTTLKVSSGESAADEPAAPAAQGRAGPLKR